MFISRKKYEDNIKKAVDEALLERRKQERDRQTINHIHDRIDALCERVGTLEKALGVENSNDKDQIKPCEF